MFRGAAGGREKKNGLYIALPVPVHCYRVYNETFNDFNWIAECVEQVFVDVTKLLAPQAFFFALSPAGIAEY